MPRKPALGSDVDVDPRQVARMQADLQRWFTTYYPRLSPLVHISAMSYEITRLVHLMTEGQLTDEEVDSIIDQVTATMKVHLHAYRTHGLRDDV